MDKVIDITKITEKTKQEDKIETQKTVEKATNPIFKKLMQFKNTKLSKKFNINDLLR